MLHTKPVTSMWAEMFMFGKQYVSIAVYYLQSVEQTSCRSTSFLNPHEYSHNQSLPLNVQLFNSCLLLTTPRVLISLF